MPNLDFFVTLWPTFPHFERFAKDERLSGIRLNTAMVKNYELDNEFETANNVGGHNPLYFDIKARQLRVKEVYPNENRLELKLNRPIEVKTPTMVLFKAGEDCALLEEVREKDKLIFKGGPNYMVYEGESLHIREDSLQVGGQTILNYEAEKIRKAREAGFDKYFISYVEGQRDIDEFREHVGDSQIEAKIENKKGLEYVSRDYKKQENLNLVAACGDLYVEVDRPHDILDSLKLIVNKDPGAMAGSRMLLSLINSPVPSFADLGQLAWLYDLGYRRMMLCDELCLKGNLLARAVNVYEGFRDNYVANREKEKNTEKIGYNPFNKIKNKLMHFRI